MSPSSTSAVFRCAFQQIAIGRANITSRKSSACGCGSGRFLAAPLADFLGETADLLEPYHLEEMVPVGMDVREKLECYWKVVMDAFQEGHHIQHDTDNRRNKLNIIGELFYCSQWYRSC